MTTQQAAEALGVNVSRVRQLVRAGALPVEREKTLRGDIFWFKPGDVETFKQQREEEARLRKEGKKPGRPLKGADQAPDGSDPA